MKENKNIIQVLEVCQGDIAKRTQTTQDQHNAVQKEKGSTERQQQKKFAEINESH